MEKARKGMVGIYQWHQAKTGKCFIGYSASMNSAFAVDVVSLQKGEHRNSTFQHLWKEDGPESFEFSILEILEYKYDLPEKHVLWLDKNKGEDIYGRPRDQLARLIPACTHISVYQDTRQAVRSLKMGTMISTIRQLVAFYREHSSNEE